MPDGQKHNTRFAISAFATLFHGGKFYFFGGRTAGNTVRFKNFPRINFPNFVKTFPIWQKLSQFFENPFSAYGQKLSQFLFFPGQG